MGSSDTPTGTFPAAASGASVRLDPHGRNGWDRHPGVRSGRRLGPGERAADLLCRAVGSWAYLALLAGGISVGVAVALPRDTRAGAVALLGLGLSILALLEVSLVLMAARRAERTATDVALYHLDQGRRAAAAAEELRGDVQRLHADIARIAAQTDKSAYPLQSHTRR